LAFWAMVQPHRWPWTGYVGGIDRASAWQTRNITDAAFLLPDAHPRKKYLVDYVQRTVEHQLADANRPIGGPRKCSGRENWVCAGQFSPWQYTWLVWSLDNAARKGWADADKAREARANLLYRLYEGKEEFTAPDGEVYRFNPAHAMSYSLAVCLYNVNFGGQENNEKDAPAGNISDNTGAMYYYTMLNVEHQYYLQGPAYANWFKALPKPDMTPADWKLDPAFVQKRFTNNPGGWHDYGNDSCSAALARYDNPRAQQMYDYVRNWMEQHPTKNRVRGLEYVN